ncbi:MAG: M48 family metallopeptidase [Oscillospiraceae bacterium]
MSIEYILKRSRRKSIALQVSHDLVVMVYSPLYLSQREIDQFVEAHSAWITASLARQRARQEAYPEPTPAQEAALQQQACVLLPERVAYFGRIMGLTPTGIKITSARTRFGSCNAKNTLCFSWRLLRYPKDAIDYVVVHELAHIAHKNHQADFYACIAAIMPDYQERRALLNQ